MRKGVREAGVLARDDETRRRVSRELDGLGCKRGSDCGGKDWGREKW